MFISLEATHSIVDIKADFFRLPMSIENLADLFVDIKTSFFGLVDWKPGILQESCRF